MAELKCKNCGAPLVPPFKNRLATCAHCGTITELPPRPPDWEDLIRNYTKLYKTALTAQNYEDAVTYCSKILELDQENIAAWVDKALATAYLPGDQGHLYDEAMVYIKVAAELAPTDPYVLNACTAISRLQADHYLALGDASSQEVEKVWNSYPHRNHEEDRVAAKATLADFKKVMDCYLAAYSYVPEDVRIAKRIRKLVQLTANALRWDPQVNQCSDAVQSLDARLNAVSRLPELTDSLRSAQHDLNRLSTQGGMLARSQAALLRQRVHSLEVEIEQQKRAAAYSVPRLVSVHSNPVIREWIPWWRRLAPVGVAALLLVWIIAGLADNTNTPPPATPAPATTGPGWVTVSPTATPMATGTGRSASPTAASSPTPLSTLYVSADGDGVYIRSRPDMGAQVKVWPDGTAMIILEQIPDWYKVRAPDGYIGYIPARYLTATAPKLMYVSADGDGVYIRSKPDMNARVRVWPDGTAMTIIEQIPDWYKVRAPDGYVGYVPARYLTAIPPKR